MGALSPGRTVADRYVLESLLGEGGMGAVYRAYDRRLERHVALKVLRADGAPSSQSMREASARMLREARSAAALAHPNVVAVHDVGEVEGATYLAMELVDGKTLREYVGDRSVPVARRVDWLADVARALKAAHDRGLVHRDVKPENVMIRDDGVVKVLDFGIARRARALVDPLALTHKPVEVLTGAGMIVGTPFYMPPEQLRGEELDGRTDQFAWGVTAYELLAGELPWGKDRDALRAIADLFSRAPPSLRTFDGQVPDAVDRAVRKTLALAPDDRFPDMNALLVALQASPDTIGTAKTLEAPAGPTVPRARRPRTAPLVVAIAVAVVAGALLVPKWLGRSTTRGDPNTGAVSASASSSASARGRAITDQPLPTSDKPDALDAYRAGLRAIRAGSFEEAESSLRRALQIDPNLGAAYVRLIPILIDQREDVGDAFRQAMRLRTELSPRDRDLLDAHAPLVESEPADSLEAARRLQKLLETYPDDAEIADALAMVHLHRLDAEASIAAASRAIELDPQYGNAWTEKVSMELFRGAFDDVRRDGTACFDRFASIDCLQIVGFADAYTGDPSTEAVARRILSLQPTSYEGAIKLAGALFSRGEPVDALRATMTPTFDGIPPFKRSHTEAELSLIAGDLARARREFEQALDATPRVRELKSAASYALVEIDEEMGDDAAALRVARAFVAQQSAYGTLPGIGFIDRTLVLMHFLVDHGAMTPEDFEAKRAQAIARLEPQAGPEGRATLWLMSYALPATSAADAKTALDALARFPEPKFHGFGGSPVGHVRLLAGDVDGALPDLERGARAALVLFDVVGFAHAHLDLAAALEAKHDMTRACAQYEWIVALWGNAKQPPSTSAALAKKRQATLGCAKK